MTLDVTIGKVIENERNKKYNRFNVVAAPSEEQNVCNPESTIYPKDAYRSSPHGFWEFWRQYCGDLYNEFREHPDTNDRDVAWLKPHIEQINAPQDKCNDDTSTDGMKWFKYWANKAVELYGDDAGIKFS